MADRADRFRRLRSVGRAGGAGKRGETGDLFEHFGVELGPSAPVPSATEAAVEAAPCCRCGWLLAYRRAEAACPMCGDPDPLSRVEGPVR
jgi:hypothetical protein